MSTGENDSLLVAMRLSSSYSSCRSTFAPASPPPKALFELVWLRLRLIRCLLGRTYTTLRRNAGLGTTRERSGEERVGPPPSPCAMIFRIPAERRRAGDEPRALTRRPARSSHLRSAGACNRPAA